MSEKSSIALTQFSHGAGCGCKLSPAVLEQIVQRFDAVHHFSDLLVGNEGKDDAAVFRVNDEQAIISTTDFFMPIVDDPFDFGQIASANSISDVYAMGGKPLMAIAILGWPIDKIPAEEAARVIEGSRVVCAKAGIPLAGGHSIDCPEPVFGLAVTGMVHPKHVKRNAGASPGSMLYLTKPIGVGIITTAQKRGLASAQALEKARDQMIALNEIGSLLGEWPEAEALTDVTGFGLLGHLLEMCEASDVSAEISFAKVPKLAEAEILLEKGCIPGGTKRNLASYGAKIQGGSDTEKHWLADPQTSGGLLISVQKEAAEKFETFAKNHGLILKPFGEVVKKQSRAISILP
jgi:selenide,water dikinase